MKTGRYKEGQRNRQAIIDHLIAHPGALGPDIIEALNASGVRVDKVTGAGRLQRMTNSGELRRERAMYSGLDCYGNTYRTPTYAYWALVTETRSQTDVAATLVANTKKREPVEEPVDRNAQKWVGGSFRNTRGDRPVTVCPDAMKGVGLRGMTQLEAAV